MFHYRKLFDEISLSSSAPSTPTLDSLLADVDVQCLPLDDEVAEEVVDIDDLSVSRLSQS